MAILKKVKKTTSAAVNKTKGVAEIVMLKRDIASLKGSIEDVEAAIGRKYYEEKGGTPDPGFEEYCAQIDSAYAKIAELKAQIRAIKRVINCPGCGKEIDVDMNFCPLCGAKIEHPEEPTDDAEAEAPDDPGNDAEDK